jgi:penicillin-binding protein 2
LKGKPNIRLRFNSLTTIIYIFGIILLLQLFNLQIIHGEEYREQSNTRLTRESTAVAARGSILDRNGNPIVENSMGFSLELYKSKVDNQTLNTTILNIVDVLEKNEDSYKDSFPIKINEEEQYYFDFDTDEKAINWKKKMKLDEKLNAQQCIQQLKEKYEIQFDNIYQIRKVLAVRYQILQDGYSTTKSIIISNNISRKSALEFNERSENFPGVSVVVEPIRQYTSGNLASHVVGTIGKISEVKEGYNANDYIGKTGIEYLFEKYLKGQDGTKQIDMSVDGTNTEEYVTQDAVEGSDVVLTIDANLQKVTEQALANNIQKINSGGFGKKYATNSGAAIVMNVKTGEVLSMASYPDFNPQDFVGGISAENWEKYNTEDTPQVNKTMQTAYAPGSIFKMVTAIAGLESGAITTKETINDTGVYPKYTNPKCWIYTDYHKGHGRLNVSGAIQHSCNYFFYETADRMGIDTLAKYAKYFGLGTKTGIELPNETSGTLASKETKQNLYNEQWYAGETLSAAIGQSYNSFSLVQIAKYISMLANGGNKIQPTIVEKIINADGTEVSREEIQNYIKEKAGITDENQEDISISQDNLRAILEGMESVTDDQGGTAYSIFKNFAISVGGKTGSAETSTGKVNAWFVGFAPYDDPQIAVVVLVENGGHGYYTAEAVKEIIEQYFGMNIEQVQENVTSIPYTESFR